MRKRKPLLYICLKDSKVRYSLPIRSGNVVIDYNNKDEIVGIEVLKYDNLTIDGIGIDKWIERKK